jgi:hypothetical protein
MHSHEDPRLSRSCKMLALHEDHAANASNRPYTDHLRQSPFCGATATTTDEATARRQRCLVVLSELFSVQEAPIVGENGVGFSHAS